MSRADLDYSKLDAAATLVAEGDAVIEVNCPRCQGMGSGREDSPGYCPECSGDAYVSLPAWGWWSLDRQREYWRARALIAEARAAG